MIITAITLKALAVQALAAGAIIGLGAYVAHTFYEKHRIFKETMNRNRDFEIVYENETFHDNFRNASIVEQIKTFDELKKEGILTNKEFNELKIALIESNKQEKQDI